MFWILLYIIILLVILSELQLQWKYRSLKKYSGPLHLPILGLYLYFYDEKKLMRNLFRLIKYYGSAVAFRIGRQMILFIADVELFDFFLRSPKYVTKADNYFFLEPWLGKGIFNSDGLEWHKIRKTVLPAFHLNIMESHVNIFQSHSDVYINILRKDADSNHPIDIYPKTVYFTLDIIAETAMGIKTNVQHNSNNEYLEALHFMTNLIVDRTLSLWKRFDFLFKLSPSYKNQLKCLKILDDYSTNAIERRKAILLENSLCNIEETKSIKNKGIFLDILLTSTIDGKPIPDEKIKSEVNTIIFGGHDTTASTISLMMFALANNKDTQDKIVNELREIYNDDPDRPVTMQDLSEMRYMELVIKEVLRYYGVVPLIGRKLTQNVDFKGTIIPKDTTLAFFLYGLHSSKTIYDNPKVFDPERFTSKIAPYSFVPFSAGPRSCIGQKYAFNEIKVTFANLLRHFEFESAGPGYEMELKMEMVMKPTKGIYVKIKSRDF